MGEIKDKIILHADLNNFYASVECMLKPELKLVPLAVAGDANSRHGIILAKNELAKKLGVTTGETIWQAKLKAPNLVLAEPHFDLYTKYSNLAFEVYTRFTSQVEPFGADECWLDVTNSTMLFGSGEQMANNIRKIIFNELGLTVSVGVSFNKVFAKMGSDLKKPDATSVITRQNFKELLYNMPASELFMVGAKTAEKLYKLNIRTIGDIAASNEAFLNEHFGINGVKMLESARGENRDEVRLSHESRIEKSIGHGLTTRHDINSYADAETLIFYLAERVGARMRKRLMRANGISLDIKNNNLEHISRQKKLLAATYTSTDIAASAIELLHANYDFKIPIRALTVSVFDLVPTDSGNQITMFDNKKALRNESLEKTLDNIKAKYGSSAISRANLLISSDFIYDKSDSEDFLPFKR